MESDLHSSPLKKSIYLRCISFVAFLGAIITFVNYEAFQKNLNARNQIYLTEIIKSAEQSIDIADLEECTRTLTPSEKFYETHNELRKILNNSNIDNIYIQYTIILRFSNKA